MSELSTKELLDCFDGMCLFLAVHGWKRKDERAVAIRELIQNQLEVSEKDIYDFHGNLFTIVEDEPNIDDEYLAERERRYIKAWLESIGVKVK